MTWHVYEATDGAAEYETVICHEAADVAISEDCYRRVADTNLSNALTHVGQKTRAGRSIGTPQTRQYTVSEVKELDSVRLVD